MGPAGSAFDEFEAVELGDLEEVLEVDADLPFPVSITFDDVEVDLRTPCPMGS